MRILRSLIHAILAVALLIFGGTAFATCGPGTHWDQSQDYGSGLCMPDATASTVNAATTAAAFSQATGGNAMATGGAQQQGQSATNTATNSASATGGNNGSPVTVGGDTSSTSVRAYALSLPNTLNVPQITQSTASCVLSEAHGVSIGWNFFAKTGATQSLSPECMGERAAEQLERDCKFRTAAIIRYRLALKSDPGMADLIGQVKPWDSERDMAYADCHQPTRVVIQTPVFVPAPTVYQPGPVIEDRRWSAPPKRRIVRKPEPVVCK